MEEEEEENQQMSDVSFSCEVWGVVSIDLELKRGQPCLWSDKHT